MYHRFRWTRASRRRNGLTQEFEPLQPYVLQSLIAGLGCRTFLDVGANVGAYSVLMSAEGVSTTAFEANADVAKELRANLRLNAIEGRIVEAAVSDCSGFLQFGTVSRLAGNSAVVETSLGQAFREVRQVPCVTLDATCAQVAAPIAIKIDVEGHETQVLAGATDLLRKPCIIQVEDFDETIAIDGYRRIFRVGPDSYLTNIDGIDAVAIFEDAARRMIDANHERKAVMLNAGDLSLSISGRSYQLLKRVLLPVIGSRL